MITITPQLCTLQDIQQRFPDLTYMIIHDWANEKFVLFDGDLTISGDLTMDWAASVLEKLGAGTDLAETLIMVNGRLTVKGDICLGAFNPHLLVLGDVYCDVLFNGEESIHITGNAYLTYAFYGYCKGGWLLIEGTTYTPYIFNMVPDVGITAQGALLINACNDDHDDFYHYDYTKEVLPDVVVPALLDDNKELKVDALIERIKSGQSPFKEGATSLRQR